MRGHPPLCQIWKPIQYLMRNSITVPQRARLERQLEYVQSRPNHARSLVKGRGLGLMTARRGQTGIDSEQAGLGGRGGVHDT